MPVTLDISGKATMTLKSNFNKNNNNSLCKTLPIKTHTTLTNPTSSTNPPSSPLHLKRNSHHHHHQTPKHVWTPFVKTRTSKPYLKSSKREVQTLFRYSKMMGIGLKITSGLSSDSSYSPQDPRRFPRKGRFEDALYYLKKMEEINLKPDTETYNGLIRAYGKYRMYDEMDQCLKKMEADGCSLDHITYNLLIQEFSRAGLLTRTEKLYQILI